MTFDALAMHAVRDELETALLGGHIEKIVPISSLEVGLRIRSRRRDYNLILSADAQSARVHLVSSTLRRVSDQVTPFLLLLRKYIRDGRIVSIEQPELERVMDMAVEKLQEDGSTTTSHLIIEVMGRHSNVILVGEDGKILDAIKRVPPSLSRQRPVLPHLPYLPPPGVDKLSPLPPSLPQQLGSAASGVSPSAPLWRFLQESVFGLGPLASREVAYRVSGSASSTVQEVSSWQQVAEALSILLRPLRTHEWTPSAVVEDGVVVHFAPYRLDQYADAGIEELNGISELIERAYSERLHLRPAESLRAPLRSSLEAKLDRARRREESLRHALMRGEKAESLKLSGQAILSSIGQIEPGQTELNWDGMKVELDPKISPQENAQHYFREYTKARDAAHGIPSLLEGAKLEREYLEQMLALVELADGDVELRALSRELSEAPSGRQPVEDRQAGTSPHVPVAGRPRRSSRPKRPGQAKPQGAVGTVKRATSSEGHQILFGGSAKGNERVTFDLASGTDIWLHARGFPGAHVILKLGSRSPTDQALLEAARIAASHSQARGDTKVPVDYTFQRYVKKVKGGPPGLVTYSQEKTIRVDAAEPDAG